VSKVANFAIDLPDANVAIQVSGTFGSRQEEAQRLGRLLRPKADGRPAHFYTIVTRDTRDQEFSANRQLFLTEQGYRYTIEDAETAGLLVDRPGDNHTNHTTRAAHANGRTPANGKAGQNGATHRKSTARKVTSSQNRTRGSNGATNGSITKRDGKTVVAGSSRQTGRATTSPVAPPARRTSTKR
jgi:superfamily II DNA or RNA helicase